MSRVPATSPPAGVPLYRRPWVQAAAGLACLLPAWLLPHLFSVPAVVRLGLAFLGAFVALTAAANRLRQAGWDLPERLNSAALVSLAGLAALIGYLAMDPAWDSGKMFFAALFILALVGAVLVLLPPLGRRVLLSLLIVFHFGGIAVAITSVDPPNSTGPWLSKQLWTRVYRPYVGFMYLTNAYHFYSPDPGPPALLWFSVSYTDGSRMWVKMPDRGNSPIGMHYQRLLALPEHSFLPQPRLPLNQLELGLLPPGKMPERGSWEEIYHRRELGSTLKFRPDGLPIPMLQDLEPAQQYREPDDTRKPVLAAIAHRVLHTAPRSADGATPRTVKMYRVTHLILSPQELAEGVDPLDKEKYVGYFMGEFDREGRLVDSTEPFLYWYLPVFKVPEDYPENNPQLRGVPVAFVRLAPKKGKLLDCLEMHAAGQLPNKKAPAGENN
jgi:hypothetical protein